MLFDCLPRLNIGSKNLALISAALLLLDYSATAIVSAATAVSYVSGEVHLPFPPIVGTLLILVIFALVGLAGLRESARIASVVLSMHVSHRACEDIDFEVRIISVTGKNIRDHSCN